MSALEATAITDDHRERYFDALVRSDRSGALAVIDDLLGDGVPPSAVLLDLVGACQREVGRCWQDGRVTVAQEHAATAISNEVIDQLVAVSDTPASAPRGRVVVACVENELHAMPARLVAATLRLSGWDVTDLGPSTTASVLVENLHRTGADATAVSCTLSSGLPHVRSLIEASRQVGVPVLVGGSGFGADRRRADLLGANAWVAGAEEAAAALDDLPASVPPAPRLDHPTVATFDALQADHDAIVTAALARLSDEVEGPKDDAVLVREVDLLLAQVEAACLVDDESVVEDYCAWLMTVAELEGSLRDPRPVVAAVAEVVTLAPVQALLRRMAVQLAAG